LNRFERKTDRPKDAFFLKLAVISFTEYDAEIDNWPNRVLISRLAMVVSLDEAHKEEDIPDDRGV
jgi:hypothetical protein